MNNLIPQHEIDRISQGADIVSIVESYGVKLRRMSGQYRGGCPFHGGGAKSTSFSVDPKSNLYHCFNCGASGSVINFIMEIGSVSFVEAVESIESNIRYDADPEQIEKTRRSKLPFNGEGIDFYESVPIDEMTGLKLVKGAEVLLTRSLSGEARSCLLFDGVTMKPFKKQMKGLCVDFGEIKDKAIICFDLSLAKKIHARKKIPVIYLKDSEQVWRMYHHRNKAGSREIKFMPVCITQDEINDCCHLAGFKIGLNENMKQINLENLAVYHSIADDENMQNFVNEFDARVVK
tara:strand:+ start:779 stop:1651 length:873 start_codon:yes stop_codon:yes gene_type:complete